jgi:hypothetical protein
VECALEDGACVGELDADFADKVDSGLCVGRAFHIGPDKNICGFCRFKKFAVIFFGEF